MRMTSTLLRMSHFLNPLKSQLEGMRELNRDAFAVRAEVPAVKMLSLRLNELLPFLKAFMVRGYLKTSPVVECGPPDEAFSLVRLDPQKIEQTTDFETVKKPEVNRVAEKCGAELRWCTAPLVLTYENFQATHIFDAILTGDLQFSSYSSVGHIIHVNLRDETEPYKQLIGEVLLDKVQPCRTVVNKTREIGESKYRQFEMEVLAGERNFNVEVKEGGCLYRFDFSKVYWNSRLSHEHERIVKKYLNKKTVKGQRKPTVYLYDCCAGVGPFAIPAAKRAKCQVLANDLNPDGYRFLCENVKLNKVEANVKPYNLDAAEFIRDVVSSDFADRLSACSSSGAECSTAVEAHCVMNLPAFAVNFLPNYCGLLRNSVAAVKLEEWKFYVHCYLFTKNAGEPEEAAKQMVEEKLREGLKQNTCDPSTSSNCPWSFADVHHVRSVAGFKEMFCVSILLHKNFLMGGENCDGDNDNAKVIGGGETERECVVAGEVTVMCDDSESGCSVPKKRLKVVE